MPVPLTFRWITAAGLAVVSPFALAVNYPTELAVRVSDSTTGAPTMLVDFMNNEGDSVQFVFETIIDGVVQPRWPGSGNGDAACVKSADPNSCDGVPTGSRGRWSNGKGHRAVEVLRIQRDTDYCFRIKATDGLHDSAWTPQVCAHTPPLPRRPSFAPQRPQVTLLESGTTGRGDVGPARPGRVLVEWNGNANEVAWYLVERADAVTSPSTAGSWAEIGRVTPPSGSAGGDLEWVESIADPGRMPGPDRRVDYRVCAANVGGKTCSTASSYPPAYLKQTVDDTPAPSRTTSRAGAVVEAGATATLRIAAPALVAPAAHSSVRGAVRVQVGATSRTDDGNAEVEFTWVPPQTVRAVVPPLASPAPRTWKAPMAALVVGAVVPPGQGPSQDGVWAVRVRALRGATPEPWSKRVVFGFSGARPAPASLPPQASPAIGSRAAPAIDRSKEAPSALATPSSRSNP